MNVRDLGLMISVLAVLAAAGCGSAEPDTAGPRANDVRVSVYFCTQDVCRADATAAQIKAATRVAERSPLVREFVFIPREAAFRRMKRRFPELAATLPANPLPDVLRITPKRDDDADEVASLFVEDPDRGIVNVDYRSEYAAAQAMRAACDYLRATGFDFPASAPSGPLRCERRDSQPGG